MLDNIFTCPVCRADLSKQDGAYKCGNGHLFDIAKEGYVNLTSPSKHTKKGSGDDRDMIRARTGFLEGGYYKPLRDKMCSLLQQYCPDKGVILDAGCGEGYYTSAYSLVAKSKNGTVVGIDLSKDAVKHTAKVCVGGEFAVASVYHLPLSDNSCDIIVNCFSPLAAEEFSRVLKTGGYFLYVVPDADHLWELKQVLYDVPYKNPVKTEEYDGFELTGTHCVSSSFTLDNAEHIQALFHMTPYTWKTPKEGVQKLKELKELDVSAFFRILVYKKV